MKTLIICILFLSSCNLNTPYSKIANLGPQSTKDVDTQDFLTTEANLNPELASLLQRQGLPEFIEIKKDKFNPYYLKAFYPNSGEVFLASRLPKEKWKFYDSAQIAIKTKNKNNKIRAVKNISKYDYYYTTKSGDTLKSISKKFTGTSLNYKKIALANSIESTTPGEKIRIPGYLIQN